MSLVGASRKISSPKETTRDFGKAQMLRRTNSKCQQEETGTDTTGEGKREQEIGKDEEENGTGSL